MSDAAPVRDDSAPCWLCQERSSRDERYGVVALNRCPGCGFLFAPERSVEDLHKLYTDDYFEDYSHGEGYTTDEAQRRHEARCRLAWMSDYTGPGRLLEIGAAAGIFLDEASRSGYDVFGVEPAAGLAKEARERFGVNVSMGFVETVDLPDEPFDTVCAWHVLEHIREPQPALRRLHSVLSHEGLLFLEIPNIESDRAKRLGPQWGPLDPQNHVGFYTVGQLAVVLGQAGFEIVDASSVSGHSYLRPGLAVQPGNLALRVVETVRSRALQGRPHPRKHELMRVVARPA